MKSLKVIIVAGAVFAAVMLLVGCATKTIDYTKTTAPDGTVTEKTVTTISGSALSSKTVAGSGSVQALKIETTGSTASGTMLPNVILGGGNSAITTSPADDNRPVCAYSRSTSILGSLTNATAAGVSWVYIGTANETAAQTAARVEALQALSDSSALSSSTGKIDAAAAVDSPITSK